QPRRKMDGIAQTDCASSDADGGHSRSHARDRNRPVCCDPGHSAVAPQPDHDFRLAAEYVDRILKGGKPSNLPVQAPTKYELAINLKAAKSLGLAIPRRTLARVPTK